MNRRNESKGQAAVCRSPASFTLLELLVVMALIAVMAALLVPTLQDVRIRARSTSCVNNLRQMGAACLMYEAEFKQFPAGENDGGISFFPYTNVFAQTGTTNVSGIYLDAGNRSAWITTDNKPDYFYNPQAFSAYTFTVPPDNGFAGPTARSSSDGFVAVFKGDSRSASQTELARDAFNGFYWTFQYQTLGGGVHGPRVNAVYMDGHAESRSLTDADIYESAVSGGYHPYNGAWGYDINKDWF